MSSSSVTQEPIAGAFEGWIAHSAAAADGGMQWGPFTPKPWEETDVDIRVTHCGVCSTDTHVMRSQLGPTTYPLVVGHEIVGVAVRVGRLANTDIRVGDRVGVGAQADACLCRKPPVIAQDLSGCEGCAIGQENWCRYAATTYNGVFHSTAAEGARTMGGYARYHRCPAYFVFKIPERIRSEHAAPLLCSGATVYAALRGAAVRGGSTNLKKPLCGMKVGIVGIGGLGHVAIQFARAMGAESVVALSRRRNKRQDALALGATAYIATDEDKDWTQAHAGTLDTIFSTVSNSVSFTDHLQILRRGGRYVLLGMPGDGGLGGFDVTTLVLKQIEITGSLISNPTEMREMLYFAACHDIRPWVEVRDMKAANKAIVDVESGKARYRIVLQNSNRGLARL